MDAAFFHDLTKHTPASVGSSRHILDWSNKPHLYKDYVDAEPTRLPDPAPDTGVPAAEAVTGATTEGERGLALAEVARILALSAGVSRQKVLAGGERYQFRTYASAGALYPNEVYVACDDLEGLDAGLYHYHPLDKELRRLRAGDPRPFLARAIPRNTVAGAPASFILSGIPWRTTWKYQARGYRHLFWDAGMILANLLALASAGGHPAEVVLGFVDGEVNALLGVDGRTEMAIAVAPAGFGAEDKQALIRPAPASAPAMSHTVRPPSLRQQQYLQLTEVHNSTSLRSFEEAGSWGQPNPFDHQGWLPAGPCPDGLEKVIRRRGSSRAFSRGAIPAEQLTDIIRRSVHSLLVDWGPPLIEVWMIVHAVEGLVPGAYRWDGEGSKMLFEGDFRDTSYHLCLDQPLGGDSSATLFLLCDLERSIERLGQRSYRAAQLEAGIVAGRIYLGAYACRFGATGLTFYDDEVRKFFDTSMEPMLAVAVGRPAPRRRLL